MLHAYLTASAARWPDRPAVVDADGTAISYRALDALSDRLRDRLVAAGVRPGDRVGFWIRKSIDGVATLFGILKAGAAYVPVDPHAPAARNCFILADCSVAAVVVERRFEGALGEGLAPLGAVPAVLAIEGCGGGTALAAFLDQAERSSRAPVADSVRSGADDLAYILYTSGSTGKPKGVQLSHANAVGFVEWCAETFQPGPQDRFSSHAPFHFDLSILDLHCAIRSGAAVVLIDEDLGKNPTELARVISERAISIWYSAPSILSLVVQSSKLAQYSYPDLRIVLFAGEVFPIKYLRALMAAWPQPRYFNLYGPTETNVCTFFEVPKPLAETRTEPVPIGRVCAHLEGVVVDTEDRPVAAGAEGELCIRGVGVTRGYWDLPERSRKAFVTVGQGSPYYRTGDIVREEPDGNLRYLGRRDRMIKKRGFRIELGEIETCLHAHPEVREAAVVALPDDEAGMKVFAHLACTDGKRLSVIQLKTFCSRRIPVYMVPDVFSFHPSLPKTSTDKIDYQMLATMSGA